MGRYQHITHIVKGGVIVYLEMSDWSPEYNTDYAELASGTFAGYITGTVKLVFIVFFIFGLLSVLTMMLMTYARYMSRGSQNQHGFHRPPSLNHRQKLQKLQEQMGQLIESSAQSDMLWRG